MNDSKGKHAMYAPVVCDKGWSGVQSRLENKGSQEGQKLKKGDIKINVDMAFSPPLRLRLSAWLPTATRDIQLWPLACISKIALVLKKRKRETFSQA
jgi:hypothetical protein